MTLPVHDLPIRIVWLLSAERRPTDQALEHDRPNTPPVATKIVPLAAENLGCNVVWRTDGRIGELTPRLAPGIDLVAIGHRELDLVD